MKKWPQQWWCNHTEPSRFGPPFYECGICSALGEPQEDRNFWDGSDCEAHEWVHVEDELMCQRCGAEYPKRDPILAWIVGAVCLAAIVCAGAAVIWWLRGGA